MNKANPWENGANSILIEDIFKCLDEYYKAEISRKIKEGLRKKRAAANIKNA